jgi:hypothetical protein
MRWLFELFMERIKPVPGTDIEYLLQMAPLYDYPNPRTPVFISGVGIAEEANGLT